MSEIIHIENVTKSYGDRKNLQKVLQGISFTVQRGEFVGIVGASGSGKTTLLNCIAMIDDVTSGILRIDGEDITQMPDDEKVEFRKQKLGFVFQDYNLLDTMTAFDNIALALSIRGHNKKAIHTKIEEIAQTLHITDILQKYPYQLSGGQKQRVAVARAIIADPALLLADEPTGALDSKSGEMLIECFHYLNTKWKTTILLVTHNPEMTKYCTRIMTIKDGILVEQ